MAPLPPSRSSSTAEAGNLNLNGSPSPTSSSFSPHQSSISKELLEEMTGSRVESYSVHEGSKPGDNYMSVMYSVEADIILTKNGTSGINRKQHINFLFKCYPRHPSRQHFLNKTNMFRNEESFYKIWVPELLNFQREFLQKSSSEPLLTPSIPPYIGGRTIDFSEETGNKNNGTGNGEVVQASHPLENFIIMTDLRKSPYNFKMVDKTKGLDLPHISLAFEELAKFHCLSWAYKCKNKLNLKENDLTNKFPFLKTKFDLEDQSLWSNIIKSNLDLAVKAIDDAASNSISSSNGNKNGKNHFNLLSESAKAFAEKVETVWAQCFFQEMEQENIFWEVHRNPPGEMVAASLNEEPWRVVCQGDAWTNNLLFKYPEPETSPNKPEAVVILDLQLVREACPTTDLVCLVYSSTNAEFRRSHLDSLLELYFTKFGDFCKKLQVPTLPGFDLHSLKRRFHRAKPIGLIMALTIYPNIFLKLDEQMNLEEAQEEKNFEKMFREAFGKGAKDSSLYRERIVELAQELYDDGVI